ncbi:unnamed protein product [Candidula unifasciata]|uniref:Helicase ARIP4 n=1 Tax=Candidula unifasciata TaxID=100452 RepID=A0A8S3ZP77_9EUPU|nr:unnamed protein product [Candidula unifasciata]
MEKVAELMEFEKDSDSVTQDLPSSSESFEYQDGQKETTSELKMIDGDILDIANQVGEEMEESEAGDTSLPDDLSFLDGAEAKETSVEVDDPALSFLVNSGKMEVTNDSLSFLEDQDLTEAEMSSGDDDESYTDDEDSEEDDDEEEEEDGDNDKDENCEEKVIKKEEDTEDDGVFGQVSFYDVESASGHSVDIQKVKKTKQKRSKKKRKAGEDGESKGTKRKRKRKRRKTEDNDDDEDVPNAGAGSMRRKNIRSIKCEKDLDKDMLSAQNEELERQKRLMELKKSLLRENSAAAATSVKVTTVATSSATVVTKTASVSTGTSTPKEKDSQLKSLLQVAEEEADEAEKDRKQLDKEVVKVKKESRETSPPSDVITLSSDSDDSDDLDDDDSDEVVMVPSDEEGDDEEEEGPEDVNNGGAHIDDSLNLPDPDGRVKVNIGHPPNEPDIYLAPQIAQAIRPHQIGGVRFLYDNVVESIERFTTTQGFGCILAHSMGLGKTIQLISFIDIFLRFTGGKRVLCIVPINTLQNWLAEFNYWLPPPEKLHPDDNLTQTRTFPLFVINDGMKTMAARAAVIEKWKETGGVLVIGYEMFRLLSSKKVAPSKPKSRAKKAAHPEVIDVEEEDKNKGLMIDMHSMLVDPGPDLVVCDEGHRIKNSGAAISQALKNIKTRRRIVLTGYPLQNNLMEYWCMVDFVRPNFLGTKSEFSNMFERPIMNGQCVDSTASDKKIMRHRSYVLHNLLEGFVQRRGHTVLQLSLPPKMEHVFMVRFSDIQRKIYCEFMHAISESGLCSWANNNPLKAFAVCCKIWNHPDILYEVLTQRVADKDNDLDIDTVEGSTSKRKKAIAKSASSASLASVETAASITSSASTASLASMASESAIDKNPITYDWAEPLMKDYIAGLLENSGKFVLMNAIVEECLAVGDKVLIFSQSLLTLNKIEEFMGKRKVPRMEINENWQRNRTYFRLDGSTSAQDREKLINQFNDPESNVWVFLLSTKAGCLGINLVAANRVIVIDASWNPCHDCQAICRVYRFGQVKSSYVYRLITDNTLEKRIYDRQINKQGMSDRIVDDMNPENKLTRRQVENLLDFEDQDFPLVDFSNIATKSGQDQVMLNVLEKHGCWLTKHPFTHESLLIDRKEMRLSKREKRLAKEGYARDKRMNVTYARPTYAAYYPQGGILPNRLPFNSRYNYAAFRRGPVVRPIASVRPMIIANAQTGSEKIKQFGGQPLRPGVTIHQVITTTEILLPGTNTGTQAGTPANKIAAGQKILVIKTPKGVYIRTNDGKMFAVRSKTGSALGETGSTPITASTTTTTTITSAGGKQVFITPNISMTTTAGGKKPPIIIVSNKKGMPITMARGGSIIRTLPYGSANLLSSLKSSLLKSETAKTTDSTTTTSSTSTTTSADVACSSFGEKGTSLADLIAGTDEDDSSGEKKMSDGTTQSELKPKMPVIVLPSLAVRTPRPLSSIQSSTVATTSPGGGTIVIMPTKPVVSMGTKRAPKNPKPRKSRAKANNSGNTEDVAPKATGGKKKGVSLLTRMNMVTTTASMSASTVGTTTPAAATASSQTQTSATAQSSSGTQAGGTTTQSKPKQKHHPPSSQFPDLTSMWHSNFGSGPPQGAQAQAPVDSSAAASSAVGAADVAANSNSSSNSFGGEGGMMTPGHSRDSMPASQETNPESGTATSSQNMLEREMQPQSHNDGFHNQYSSVNQAYNSMNNPYMPAAVDPYAMGPMDGHMPPYMLGMHQGFMPPPPGPFSQSLPPPPSQMQSQAHGGRNMMYGSSQSSGSSQFGSTFGPSSQQMPPPYGSTANGGSMYPGPSNPSPFGYGYGAPTTASSFMSQPQGNETYHQPQSNMPFYSPQNTSPSFAMEMPSNHEFAPQNPHQQHSVAPSSSSTTSTSHKEPGLMSLDKNIPSPSPSPRHAADTPESNKSYMDLSNSRPNNTQNNIGNISQGFGSSTQSMSGSGSNFSYQNFPSDNSSSNSSGYGMSTSSTLSSALSSHASENDMEMGGSAFRAHQGSSVMNMPAKPQPFRLDKSGIGGGGNSPGFNYNSGMSAFTSPGIIGGNAGGFVNSPPFGSYGSGYGGGALPFSSAPMMSPPQNMMGYPQASLGYPSMSSLMMGSVPPAPPTMGGSMWPMMPPAMMGGGYSYPPHPSSMGFPSGLDGQGFNHLGPGPGAN